MSRRRRFKSRVRSGAIPGARKGDTPSSDGTRWRRLAVVGALALLLGAGGLASWLLFLQPASSGPPRAAIVDQLSLTFPNPDFREEATRTLERAGYIVDYIPGKKVTVDFYRTLPEEDYDVLILRAHSARLQEEVQGEQRDEAVIFSNQPYENELYVEEQAKARLGYAYTYRGAPLLFGITADFVESSMTDDFDGATVIMMGCEGFASERTAEAFVDKGAESYISWNNTVSASHTDAATERLLQHMLIDGLTAGDAVTRTMAEVGPDPVYDSFLRAYTGEGSSS